MGLSVNTNVAAINAYRNLSSTQSSLSKSLEKLSSGYRINRAADDAAGLAISEGLRSQVSGLTQAARNAQDGISVVQTAEGSLTEVHSILHRMRDLAVQAANDSNSTDARKNIATEASQLQAELGRIANSTNFNGTTLLDKSGTAAQLTFQVGANGDTNSTITVDLSSANVSNVAGSLLVGSQAGGTVTNASGTLTFTSGAVATAVTLAATAADASALATALNASTVFTGAGYSASTDASGNLLVKTSTPGGVTVTGGTGYTATAGLSVNGLDFSSATGAQAAISSIDAQINKISTARANLGAYQNRFEHTINSVNVAVENLSASESRIRDTDMASEMVNFTKSQILSQAGTAMLAQANQIPQGVLKLLQ